MTSSLTPCIDVTHAEMDKHLHFGLYLPCRDDMPPVSAYYVSSPDAPKLFLVAPYTWKVTLRCLDHVRSNGPLSDHEQDTLAAATAAAFDNMYRARHTRAKERWQYTRSNLQTHRTRAPRSMSQMGEHTYGDDDEDIGETTSDPDPFPDDPPAAARARDFEGDTLHSFVRATAKQPRSNTAFIRLECYHHAVWWCVVENVFVRRHVWMNRVPFHFDVVGVSPHDTFTGRAHSAHTAACAELLYRMLWCTPEAATRRRDIERISVHGASPTAECVAQGALLVDAAFQLVTLRTARYRQSEFQASAAVAAARAQGVIPELVQDANGPCPILPDTRVYATPVQYHIVHHIMAPAETALSAKDKKRRRHDALVKPEAPRNTSVKLYRDSTPRRRQTDISMFLGKK